MKADAVIFDKDGTLIDFDAFWVDVSVRALEDVLQQLQMEKVPVSELLEPLGVHNSVTDMEGVLCKGTYELMGRVVYEALKRHGCSASCREVTALSIAAYNKEASTGAVKPTCPDLKDALLRLKARGKKLAVVTTDNYQITEKCLRELGIDTLFDKIYTDDGKSPLKPAPHCGEDFIKWTGLEKDRVVMVGDTMTDVTFARNVGITMIGLASKEKNRQHLAPHADVVISRLSQLPDLLD